MTGSGWECLACVEAARKVFGDNVRPIGGGGVLSGMLTTTRSTAIAASRSVDAPIVRQVDAKTGAVFRPVTLLAAYQVIDHEAGEVARLTRVVGGGACGAGQHRGLAGVDCGNATAGGVRV
jgi:hypothetical protein